MSDARTGSGRGSADSGAGPVVVQLSQPAKSWRLAVVAAALSVLATAAFVDTDDYFPLGRLSQYASAQDRDGTVRSVYILADTAAGEQVRVPLNPTGVGVGRAEIEGQLGRIIDDPSLLQAIANAWEALHPDQPQYRTLYLMRDTYHLVAGSPSGRRATEELTRWRVQP
jgi:hypothetical protein